jgi:hypothetical protein
MARRQRRSGLIATLLGWKIRMVVSSRAEDISRSLLTCNTRSSVHERTMGVPPVYYTAHSVTRKRSRSPTARQVIINRAKKKTEFARRTRKKRHPTRDWKPAILLPVCQYSPPQNTPRNAEITICARKNVLSLKHQNQSAHHIMFRAFSRTVAAPSIPAPRAPAAASRTQQRSSAARVARAHFRVRSCLRRRR